MSTVVSAKVPKTLKAKAQKYGIVISKVVRTALQAEVAKAEEDELHRQLAEVRQKLRRKITKQDLVKAVRATREER